jgi:hypothetical protein
MLGLGDALKNAAPASLAEWLIGGACLLWLLILLKAPWDLYFKAHEVVYEIERSTERGMSIPEGRYAYVKKMRRILGWLALAAHGLSAALVWVIGNQMHSRLGDAFAMFYLVSTMFRPGAAAYAHLWRRLVEMRTETIYPREDALQLRIQVEAMQSTLEQVNYRLEQMDQAQAVERSERAEECAELRQSIHAISREFETTLSKLTDNQDVIRGIQAFVRLIGESGARA